MFVRSESSAHSVSPAAIALLCRHATAHTAPAAAMPGPPTSHANPKNTAPPSLARAGGATPNHQRKTIQWAEPDLNRQPQHFQCCALPIELSARRRLPGRPGYVQQGATVVAPRPRSTACPIPSFSAVPNRRDSPPHAILRRPHPPSNAHPRHTSPTFITERRRLSVSASPCSATSSTSTAFVPGRSPQTCSAPFII